MVGPLLRLLLACKYLPLTDTCTFERLDVCGMNKMFTFKACSSVLDFGGRRSDGMLGNTFCYLRLWTQINGSWGGHYVDTTFTTSYGTAHLTNPLNGATNTDPFAPFTWNSVPTATSYTLNIGSSMGAADVFNSGPVTATSITVPSLQINTKYYATLYTQFSSGTQSSASTFTTGTGLAHLITPANGATNVVPGSTFTWNSVSNAQAYYLYIGTSVVSQNVYGSNAITATSVTPSNLALNTLYYARMW